MTKAQRSFKFKSTITSQGHIMNNDIKKLTTVIFSLICCSANAGTIGDIAELKNPKENVYLGAGVGASLNNNQFTANATSLGNVVNSTMNDTYALANVFLGYGQTFRNYLYLGGEANIYSARKLVFKDRQGVVSTNNVFDEQYTVQDYLTMDMLPGYRPNSNTLIYARVGLAFRNMTFHHQAVVEQPLADSTNSVGGRFGGGLTYAITKKFAASVDYFYTYAPTYGTFVPASAIQFTYKTYSNYIGGSFVVTI